MNDDNKPTLTYDCWNKIGVWSRAERRCESLEHLGHCHNCDTYIEFARTRYSSELNESQQLNIPLKTRSEPAETQGNQLTVLIFRVGNSWLAIPVAALDEISEHKIIHTLPHNRKRSIMGLVAIRGNLLTCINLHPLLHPTRTAHSPDDDVIEPEASRLIVVGNASQRYALYANEAEKTETIDTSEIPSDSNHKWPGFISARFSLAKLNISLINPDVLMERLEGNLL